MRYLSNYIGLRTLEPIELPDEPQINLATSIGFYPTEALSCQGKSRIVIKSTFSHTNITAKARLTFYDISDNVIGYTDEFYIRNTGQDSDDGRYHGTMFVLANEMGASSFKVRLTRAPIGGNISMFIGVTN